MAAKNDPPTNQHLGFGYEEARVAGVPWDMIKPRPAAEAIAHGKANKERKEKFLKEVASLMGRLPNAAEIAKSENAAGKTNAEVIAILEDRAKEQDRLRVALAKHGARKKAGDR